MKLVAVLRNELIESEDGLTTIVVVDFYEKGPESRSEWVTHISGVEIEVPKRATDDEIQVAIDTQTLYFEDHANITPTPTDVRIRSTLSSVLVGVDREPSRSR